MNIFGLLTASALLLGMTGCVIVPASTARSACEMLAIASDEADLAPAWYINAGEVLEACGHPHARASGAERACYSEARNGYRDRAECEVTP